ncbi:LysR family transcriptional regulator [Pantoea sp. Ap-967]|uniref:LysR family transcriptional regulator n=1 Tax=Pantoea sp. Ap-967 TaxID=2608362 RepID=UPI001423DC35|nr:LysR family transcriptional regulator [Pantoea sp. Ap-967]NIE75910.1 LysR family transcriptional regulator [Pantoea sp. Ap-967]
MDLVYILKVFIAIAELGNFGEAAAKLDVSPAAISRAINALEKRLGASLVLRTTRNVGLTEAGLRYLEHAKNIIQIVSEADQSITEINANPTGNICVTAPTLFGKFFVMPTIRNYLEKYPQVDISAYFNDRIINLVDEGVDVAVRIGHLPDSGFKAIRVGTVRRVLCASPAYLEKHGTPATPRDLPNHAVIAASGVAPRVEWKFTIENESTVMRITPRLTVTSNDVAIEAATEGLGIARVHSYQILTELKNNKLALILEDFENDSYPITILHRETKQSSIKVREFIDNLTNDLRSHDLN